MNAISKHRRNIINITIIVVIVIASVNLTKSVSIYGSRVLSETVIVLTSVGGYKFFIFCIDLILNKSHLALKFYWGRPYISGIWSYEYILENTKYFGIWSIEQDVDSTAITGSGLNDDFSIRTIVRSVSPLIEENNAYYVINLRNEVTKGVKESYSKTTLIIDRPKNWYSVSDTMWGTTKIFGGPSDDQFHASVIFRRQKKFKTMEELIENLKSSRV